MFQYKIGGYATYKDWLNGNAIKNGVNKSGKQVYRFKGENRSHRITLAKKLGYYPRPKHNGEKIYDAFELLNNLPKKLQKIFIESKFNFMKEHEKYKDYLRLYKDDPALKEAKEIIVIGVGGAVEKNEFGEIVKNEILVFLELGYSNKLTLMGLYGKFHGLNIEKTKEVKYQMWKNMDVQKIIRCWVDRNTPLKIPFSKKKTLFVVVLDGKKETADIPFLKALRKRRPNCIIDYFRSARLGQEKSWLKSLKESKFKHTKKLVEWKSPIPTLRYYRSW